MGGRAGSTAPPAAAATAWATYHLTSLGLAPALPTFDAAPMPRNLPTPATRRPHLFLYHTDCPHARLHPTQAAGWVCGAWVQRRAASALGGVGRPWLNRATLRQVDGHWAPRQDGRLGRARHSTDALRTTAADEHTKAFEASRRGTRCGRVLWDCYSRHTYRVGLPYLRLLFCGTTHAHLRTAHCNERHGPSTYLNRASVTASEQRHIFYDVS